MKKTLVVVDMQNDFVTGSLGTKMAQDILPNVVDKVKKAKEEGVEIIFTKDSHNEEYLNTLEGKMLPVEHCIECTDGWEIIPQLEDYVINDEKETNVVLKKTFGSHFLNLKIPMEVEEIELIGVCTDICVVSNALLLRASRPNIKIVVDSSCCAGTSIEAHNSALQVMKSCQIDII